MIGPTDLLRKGLKLSHLRLMAGLAETGQIGLTAAQMGIAQPAASRLLAEVERIARIRGIEVVWVNPPEATKQLVAQSDD